MGFLPDTWNCGLRMRRECRERFPRHRGLAIPTCITARAWRTRRDACRERWLAVSFEVGGGKNVPGTPGACATKNFMHLVRGPWNNFRIVSKPFTLSIHSARSYIAHLYNFWLYHCIAKGNVVFCCTGQLHESIYIGFFLLLSCLDNDIRRRTVLAQGENMRYHHFPIKDQYTCTLKWRQIRLMCLVSHRPFDCLLQTIFRLRTKKPWKLFLLLAHFTGSPLVTDGSSYSRNPL